MPQKHRQRQDQPHLEQPMRIREESVQKVLVPLKKKLAEAGVTEEQAKEYSRDT